MPYLPVNQSLWLRARSLIGQIWSQAYLGSGIEVSPSHHLNWWWEWRGILKGKLGSVSGLGVSFWVSGEWMQYRQKCLGPYENLCNLALPSLYLPASHRSQSLCPSLAQQLSIPCKPHVLTYPLQAFAQPVPPSRLEGPPSPMDVRLMTLPSPSGHAWTSSPSPGPFPVFP